MAASSKITEGASWDLSLISGNSCFKLGNYFFLLFLKQKSNDTIRFVIYLSPVQF